MTVSSFNIGWEMYNMHLSNSVKHFISLKSKYISCIAYKYCIKHCYCSGFFEKSNGFPGLKISKKFLNILL